MREYKFRGQARGEWVHGSLIVCEDGRCVINWVDGLRHVSTDIGVVPETVGQYTGLKDSEGREIYEGDILSLREGSDEMIQVIDFYAAITALDLSEMMNLRLLDYYFERGEVRVIGNVHDNPELLEVES